MELESLMKKLNLSSDAKDEIRKCFERSIVQGFKVEEPYPYFEYHKEEFPDSEDPVYDSWDEADSYRDLRRTKDTYDVYVEYSRPFFKKEGKPDRNYRTDKPYRYERESMIIINMKLRIVPFSPLMDALKNEETIKISDTDLLDDFERMTEKSFSEHVFYAALMSEIYGNMYSENPHIKHCLTVQIDKH